MQKKNTKPQPVGRTVNIRIITTAFITAPAKMKGRYFPILKRLFSMIELIIRSFTASHTIHTTIAADITVNCATVSFIVYWIYVSRNMLTNVYAASRPVAPTQ
jgi:hypothetical protein